MGKPVSSAEPHHPPGSTMESSDPESRRLREWNAAAMGGYRALDAYTLERFRATPETESILLSVQKFDHRSENLYLYGPTGVGKSHLAAIASRRQLPQVSTVTQMSLSREVRSSDGARGELQIIDRYVKKSVLVLDDLGVGKDTEFSLSLLYEIIHGRYMNSRGGLIVTSNLSLGEVSDKLGDDRLSSRLAQMCQGRIFHITGKDYRVNP